MRKTIQKFLLALPIAGVSFGIGMGSAISQTTGQAPSPIVWANGVPANALVGGDPVQGKPLHICRLKMPDGQLHPGVEWSGNCYVGNGGKTVKMPATETLVVNAPTAWVPAAGGKIPPNAPEAGIAAGAPMHLCRAVDPSKQTRPGKEWKGTCYISYGADELKVAQFDVLTIAAAAPATPPPSSVAPTTANVPGSPTESPAAPPVLNHNDAMAACKAHAGKTEALNDCMHQHHRKTMHPVHHVAHDHALKICRHHADPKTYAQCMDHHHKHHHHKHYVLKHKPHGHKLNHKAAHDACAAHVKDHNAHKKCLFEHHAKTAPAQAQESLKQAFDACHVETDLAKHAACLDAYHQ